MYHNYYIHTTSAVSTYYVDSCLFYVVGYYLLFSAIFFIVFTKSNRPQMVSVCSLSTISFPVFMISGPIKSDIYSYLVSAIFLLLMSLFSRYTKSNVRRSKKKAILNKAQFYHNVKIAYWRCSPTRIFI